MASIHENNDIMRTQDLAVSQRDADAVPVYEDLDSVLDTFDMSNIPPPPIPRKSSRRRLRPMSMPVIQTQMISGLPIEQPRDTSESALELAIAQLERSNREDVSRQRLPSHWSTDSSVVTSPADDSSSPRSSTSSKTSQWSEPLPEYPFEGSLKTIAEPTGNLTLTAADKELLRASYIDEEADLTPSGSESVYSTDENIRADELPNPSFESKRFSINAKGMASVRLPLPSKELEIQITNSDGTVAYVSKRDKRSSPTSFLGKPGMGDLIKTSYDSQPTLTYLGRDLTDIAPFKMTGKGLRRGRVFKFSGPEEREFEWKYVNDKTESTRGERLVLVEKLPESTGTLLGLPTMKSQHIASQVKGFSQGSENISDNAADVSRMDKAKRLLPGKGLQRSLSSSTRPTSFLARRLSSTGGVLAAAKATAPKASPRILAQLTRTEEAPQNKGKGPKQALRAGIGGELVLEPGCTDTLPEEVVVATALVMLKREQDRLRAVQAAILVTVLL